MSSFVVPASDRPVVPVSGEQGVFPVRRIYCVGRNYAEHAREMGHDPDRDPPFFFCKPADAVCVGAPGQVLDVPYPPMTQNLHHELEMVVAIGKGGADIAEDEAMRHVYGYAVGLDLTRRDRQNEAKELRRPWEVSKAFDASAPIGHITPVARAGNMADAAMTLEVNGSVRQTTHINQMIWSTTEVISHLSRYFRLEPGDLIFTGTPEGVAATVAGDRLDARLEGVDGLSIRLV